MQFNNLICSFSFATGICSMATGNWCEIALMILMSDSFPDHFLRAFACSCRKYVLISDNRDLNIEMLALVNCFWATVDWADEIEGREPPEVIEIISQRSDNDLPPLAAYVLRAALTIAAFDDPSGETAIWMCSEARSVGHQVSIMKRNGGESGNPAVH
jgi:hypothetical protein